MIFEIKIQANEDRLLVEASQLDLRLDVPALVAMDLDAWQILGAGEPQSEIERKVTQFGGKIESVEFIHPFDIQQFDPQLASLLLYNYVTRLKLDRALRSRFGVFRYFTDRYRYEIHIEGYENLPRIKRAEFENLLRRTQFPRLLSLQVNGQDIR